jgi:hypothetical protein
MNIRTTRSTITFRNPFYLKGVDRFLPPGDYGVVTDEELIQGLSFPAYRRISTAIFVPAPSGSAIEMVTIDPWISKRRRNLTRRCSIAEPPPLENFASSERMQPYARYFTCQVWRSARQTFRYF